MLSLVKSLDDDVTIEEAIGRLQLLRKIEKGLQESALGEGVEHDELMKQLEDEVA